MINFANCFSLIFCEQYSLIFESTLRRLNKEGRILTSLDEVYAEVYTTLLHEKKDNEVLYTDYDMLDDISSLSNPAREMILNANDCIKILNGEDDYHLQGAAAFNLRSDIPAEISPENEKLCAQNKYFKECLDFGKELKKKYINKIVYDVTTIVMAILGQYSPKNIKLSDKLIKAIVYFYMGHERRHMDQEASFILEKRQAPVASVNSEGNISADLPDGYGYVPSEVDANAAGYVYALRKMDEC